MRFEKWQALGNDYLIIETDALPWNLTPARIRRICDPHSGVGSDGILLLSRPASAEHVAELRIFNPDGSEAELSGNGAREAILYLRHRGWTGADSFSILTPSGPVAPQITSARTCTVQMGRAATASPDFPSGAPDGRGTVPSGGRTWHFRHVSIGNPQCAIRVEQQSELEQLDLGQLGPPIEASRLFPNRSNVSFFTVEDSTVRARIFERGVGETLSSGTGAIGAAVAAFLDGAASPIRVELDGGELTVGISPDLDVNLSGWAEPVFLGELAPEMIANLGRLDD